MSSRASSKLTIKNDVTRNRAIYVGVAGLVAVASTAAAAYVHRTSDDAAAAEAENTNGDDDVANEAGGSVPVVIFDAFTAELKSGDDDDEHRVRLSFGVEASSLRARDEVEESRAQIRDRVIELMADHTTGQLRGADNLEALKQLLQKEIEDIVPGDAIKAVYIEQILVK